MADLNALIAQGAQFQAPVDPFAQYGKMQQLQQGQQANQLNQMKMEEYQRGLQEQNALRSSVSSDFDINNPAHVNAVLRASPTAGAAFLEKFSQGAKERGLAEKAKNEAIKFNLDNSRSLLVGINDQPSYDAWRAYSVKTLPQLADMLPTAFSQDAKDRLMQAADDVSKQLTAAPVYENAAPGATVLRNGVPIYTAPAAPEKSKKTDLQVNYEYAKDQGFTGSIFDYERKLKEAGRPPAAPAQPQAPVAVVDPVTGKQVYVTREEALSKRMAPASAMEGLTPKEIQTREAKYPAATLAVKTIESSSDRLASDLEALAKHPGLSGISGLVYGNTPAITKDARVALEKYKSILARGGFAELQAMRSASPTGGALGNVSNQENQYLRDAFAAIGRSQDTADLKTALESAANVARASKQRVRDAYDMTYDYKTGGGAAAPALKPAGGGALSPAEEAELAQLRKRFGK
jgi:hypothetical protein